MSKPADKEEDPSVLRDIIYALATWTDGSAACWCDSEGRRFHTTQCTNAADALGVRVGRDHDDPEDDDE